MTDAVWHEYTDPEAMASASATAVGDIISAALARKGSAVVAVPGGGTPRPVMERLKDKPLAWEKVTIFPGDDRLVARDDRLSNFAMVDKILGSTGATLVSLIGDDLDPVAAAADAEIRLAALEWPPDLIWLGIGEDGHTASILPGPDCQAALRTKERVMTVTPDPLPPEAPVKRVTLTGSAIRSAGTIMLTITGQTKRQILEHALAEGERSAYPVGPALAGTKPIIHWSP